MRFQNITSDNEPFRSEQNSKVIFIDFFHAIFDRLRSQQFKNLNNFANKKYGKRKDAVVVKKA